MPISVTCQCGARLEIDEKFLGKEIPCPDCQRPLPTKAPPIPPPLDLPSHRKKSGLAVLSLTLAMVGACFPLASIAAIVTGVFALNRIAKNPNKLEGTTYARAGIVVAGVCLFLTIAAMSSPYIGGVDQLLREFVFAGRVTHSTGEIFENVDKAEMKRLDNWAKWTGSGFRTNVNEERMNDPIILVNLRDDAYVAGLNAVDLVPDDPKEKQKKALEHVYQSELISVIGRLRRAPFKGEGTIIKEELVANGNKQELVVDLYLGGHWRRMLVQYPNNEKVNVRILVAVARPGRFDRLQKEFREMFDSAKFMR